MDPNCEPKTETVQVLVCMHSHSDADPTDVETEIRSYLEHSFAAIPTGSLLPKNNSLSAHVLSIRTVEAASPLIPMADVKLEIIVYSHAVQDKDRSEHLANISNLPSVHLEGHFESLVLDANIKLGILRYVNSSLLFSDLGVDPNIISVNRVILLTGPPGTGKTTLCKGIAQQISIRFGQRYPETRLVEINAHSLFSKFFSESGKLVERLFAKIHEIIENPNVFVVLLIDEVESIVMARKSSLCGNEPSDAIRVVNQLLTQIDSLKSYPNVMMLCTSNMTEAIDVAFIDRADYVQHLGPPGFEAVYGILKSCLAEMIKCDIIECVTDANGVFDDVLADFEDIPLALGSACTAKLVDIAAMCDGISGRRLRKLCFICHCRYFKVHIFAYL